MADWDLLVDCEKAEAPASMSPAIPVKTGSWRVHTYVARSPKVSVRPIHRKNQKGRESWECVPLMKIVLSHHTR